MVPLVLFLVSATSLETPVLTCLYIYFQLSEIVDRKLFCSTSITFLKNGPGMSLNRGVSVALKDIEVVPFLSYILRTPKEKKTARSIGCLSVDDY